MSYSALPDDDRDDGDRGEAGLLFSAVRDVQSHHADVATHHYRRIVRFGLMVGLAAGALAAVSAARNGEARAEAAAAATRAANNGPYDSRDLESMRQHVAASNAAMFAAFADGPADDDAAVPLGATRSSSLTGAAGATGGGAAMTGAVSKHRIVTPTSADLQAVQQSDRRANQMALRDYFRKASSDGSSDATAADDGSEEAPSEEETASEAEAVGGDEQTSEEAEEEADSPEGMPEEGVAPVAAVNATTTASR